MSVIVHDYEMTVTELALNATNENEMSKRSGLACPFKAKRWPGESLTPIDIDKVRSQVIRVSAVSLVVTIALFSVHRHFSQPTKGSLLPLFRAFVFTYLLPMRTRNADSRRIKRNSCRKLEPVVLNHWKEVQFFEFHLIDVMPAQRVISLLNKISRE